MGNLDLYLRIYFWLILYGKNTLEIVVVCILDILTLCQCSATVGVARGQAQCRGGQGSSRVRGEWVARSWPRTACVTESSSLVLVN